MIIVGKDGVLRNSEDFPRVLRDHCMNYVKHWKNSRVFLELMERQYDERFEESNKRKTK